MRLNVKVLRIMREEGISSEELLYMLEHAAITKVRGFNRRYFHWLFKFKNDYLQDMEYAEVVEVGEGDSRMLEDHAACRGYGCRECGWIGEISRGVRDLTAIKLVEKPWGYKPRSKAS